jgi:ABC-type multidrug transport system permease subunit
MEIILISFIAALGYLIILCKMFTPEFVARTQVLWDIVFTVGVPLLFLGTFSGMATAFLAGIWFSVMTFFLGTMHPRKRERMIRL